jgi:hypothetical protein
MLGITKEYKMTPATALLTIVQTFISATIIFLAWGNDSPICNFALVFGGSLLGHAFTEALNFVEKEEG